MLHILRAARDEARPFLQLARRAPAFAQLTSWLAGSEPSARLVCDDTRLRMGLSFALAAAALRAGFEVVLVPLGPDLWRDRDVMSLLDRRLSTDLATTPSRYRRQHLVDDLAERPPGRPLLVVADGVEDSDPRFPWSLFAGASGPTLRLLLASAGPAVDPPAPGPGRRGPTFAAASILRVEPRPPARPEGKGGALVDLLACSVGALSREEIRRALGSAPRLDACAAWVVEEGERHQLRRALRDVALAHVRRAARRRWDLRLAALPTRYGLASGAVHLDRAGASMRALGALLAPSRLARWREERGAPHGFAFDAERVRLVGVDRLAPGAAPALALAVQAALTEATMRSFAASPRRRVARPGDERKLARALLGLAGAARAPASISLAQMALRVARRIEPADERADVLIELAQRARGVARARLVLEALAAGPAPAPGRATALALVGPVEGAALLRALVDEGEGMAGRGLLAIGEPRPRAPRTRDRGERAPEAGRAALLGAVAAVTHDQGDVEAALPIARDHATGMGDDQPLAWIVPDLDRAALDALFELRDRISFDLQRAVARRLVSLGTSVEAVLTLARDEDERLRLLADALPVTRDREPRAADLAAWIAALPDPERTDALVTLGTVLAQLGQGRALLPFATSRLAALALALGERRCARALAPALAAWALADEEGYMLLQIVPMAGAFGWDDLRRLVGAALEGIASDHRGAALAGDGVSLAAVAPLLARVAGDAGLLATARAALAVARAFP